MLNLISAEEGKQLTKRRLRNYEHISLLDNQSRVPCLVLIRPFLYSKPKYNQIQSSTTEVLQNTTKFHLDTPKYNHNTPKCNQILPGHINITKINCATKNTSVRCSDRVMIQKNLNTKKLHQIDIKNNLHCKNKIIK